MKKTYYQIVMKSLSPLRISGGNDNTDNDVILDGRGYPFIPGTSLAGVLRAMVPEEDMRNELFGYEIDALRQSESGQSSRVLVSDGVLDAAGSKDFYVLSRDGIGLDEWGMTIDGAKYDFEAVETTKPYIAILECDFLDEKQEQYFDKLMRTIVAHGIRLGARTTRGYGLMDADIRKRQFCFPEDLEHWLSHDPFEDGYFTDDMLLKEGNELGEYISVEAKFIVTGSLLIREKQVNTSCLEDGSNPDVVTLKNSQGCPVIPGTAWAGVFRHHMLRLLEESEISSISEDEVNGLFGRHKEENTKSLICFSESVISGGSPYSVVRNAIDRFTGTTITGGLFTTQAWSGGNGKLAMAIPKKMPNKLTRQLICAVLNDLDNGLVTVGGEASIGRGTILIQAIRVNGKDMTKQLKEHELNLLEV